MTTKILCPTRGGLASYPNQDRAIALAKDRNEDLIFLYVSDVTFLDHTAAPKVVDIESELDEMGDFFLTMAVERAENADVDAEGIVRRGAFKQVLKDILNEYEISLVVLGQSREDTSTLPPDFIENLAKTLNTETGIEIALVHEGKIVKTIKK